MRRLVALVVAVCSLAPLATSSLSRADEADTSAQAAAKEIADARERANRAADALFSAESRIDTLAIQHQQLEAEIADLQAQVDDLHAKVLDVAINRFTGAGSESVPLLSSFQSTEDKVQKDVFIDVINETSAADFDRFDSISRDLADKQQQLADNQAKAEQERENMVHLKDNATAEVERLKAVEAQRLQDQRVKDALAAEEAARARKAELAAKAEAAKAPVTTVVDESQFGGSDGGGEVVPVAVGVGSDVAGQTGNGGSGGRIGGTGGIDYGGADWVCPTGDSAVAFGDTWGAPRSGGRRHQGVDMIGAVGTPIYAVVDGFAQAKTNTLGGTTVWFTGNDGNKYYYAHLDHYGELGVVAKGTVIAFMGQTGNAQFSVPHLHFEIHPGGGPAVNPYPTVRAHC